MSLTKISNNSLSAISTLPASIPTGALTLLSTQTASASASIEFTSGIDSTYSSYIFKIINCHPASDNRLFQFNGSTDGGSTYAVTKTTTNFKTWHNEADTNTTLGYDTGNDLAQSTADQRLAEGVGADADQNVCGTLQLFNPASTTYVKHFIARSSVLIGNVQSNDNYVAGYFNDTNDLTNIKFQFASGNIDDGKILMFGLN
jgi:hypothetical protein